MSYINRPHCVHIKILAILGFLFMRTLLQKKKKVPFYHRLTSHFCDL